MLYYTQYIFWRLKFLKKFFEEFKKFALRGNVVDLAVGMIIGTAFTGIVTALKDNFIQPILDLVTGAKAFSDYTGGILKGYVSAFISAIINFIIIAFVLFLIIIILKYLIITIIHCCISNICKDRCQIQI